MNMQKIMIPLRTLKLTAHKANIIFIIVLFLYISVVFFSNYQKNIRYHIVSLGHILQIAIPFYVLVPVLWKKDFKGLSQMLKMLAITIGITWIFKLGLAQLLGFHHIRPDGRTMSFPSGHTAAAFSGAIFLSIRYGLRYLLTIYSFSIFCWVFTYLW
jgi:membrane-associated phospholipid phosphatase